MCEFDFFENHQFHVIYCVTLGYVGTFFEEFLTSLIHDFEEYLTESVGPVPFSAEHLICRYVRTDRQTDRQTDRRQTN